MHKNLIAKSDPRSKGARWILALALTVPGAGFAQQQSELAVGDETRTWVELQTSNNASLGPARPMPGDVANEVYSRYVKSFSHPIPEHFEREKFTSSSGGGGGQ